MSDTVHTLLICRSIISHLNFQDLCAEEEVALYDPYGHCLTKPVWGGETIIYAELDMNLPAARKMEHDAIGHYARPEVLELKVNEK